MAFAPVAFVFVAGAFAFAPGVVASPPLCVVPVAGSVVTGALVTGAGATGYAGVASDSPETTEREPVTIGSDSVRATSMKSAAATIVTFARMVCVPRGPKAVLDTELVKSAPASALPGCKSTATISTMQDRRNSPYKR